MCIEIANGIRFDFLVDLFSIHHLVHFALVHFLLVLVDLSLVHLAVDLLSADCLAEFLVDSCPDLSVALPPGLSLAAF